MEIKEILERIALPARSGKKGFKVTDKLEAVEALLSEENSPYYLVHKSSQAWIFGKKTPVLNTDCFLVSTHSDIVDGIKNPHSEYIENEKYFKGTYDNLGTNAACVNLMLNENLPDNVYFAFTADEETGRCNGADYALKYMKLASNREPMIFALDVTDEGYDNNRLFTIEGLHGKNEGIRRKMLEIFMETEGEEQSFEVVRLKKKDDNSFLPESYQAKNTTVYDESVFYANKNCNSCSICLPTDGSMHSDSGLYVKEAVMKGYSLALAAGILSFTTQDRTRIDEIKAEKDALVKQAKETVFHKFYNSYSPSFYGYGGSSYFGNGGYSGDIGSYWVNKAKERLSQKSYDDNTIAGQMSLADYKEMRDYNEGFSLPVVSKDTFQQWKDFVKKCCGSAALYSDTEKDKYMEECMETFSFYDLDEEDFPDLEETLDEIFEEYHYVPNYEASFSDMEDEMWMDQIMREAAEIACGYDKNDFDVFLSDFADMYGIPQSDELEESLLEIFAEMHPEEDYDYEDM